MMPGRDDCYRSTLLTTSLPVRSVTLRCMAHGIHRRLVDVVYGDGPWDRSETAHGSHVGLGTYGRVVGGWLGSLGTYGRVVSGWLGDLWTGGRRLAWGPMDGWGGDPW